VVDLKFGNMGKIFESEFRKGVMVAVVDSGDYQYQQLAPLFTDYGYGFVAPDHKLIFIDGELPNDVQKIVEAHEVGHIVMGHGSMKGVNDEVEADSWAILYLRKAGYSKEADRLTIEFKKRHGFSYNHAKNKSNKIKVLTKIFINGAV
jgi:hypothetical protein